ncbi:uncharacterized protein LOC122566686 isoform X4 [Bombus pyrosoma]|uniref:uncharacterized protein LOC122566686 isoform X4 n=1 Tax=Bombus pyrosoma TaxID=396416 RepID=UPI001CB8D8AD|nr:uncharacterized protein LOC122566686 isoform X4 [Bombus pyrosoma]
MGNPMIVHERSVSGCKVRVPCPAVCIGERIGRSSIPRESYRNTKGTSNARHVRLRIRKSKHAFGQVARNVVAISMCGLHARRIQAEKQVKPWQTMLTEKKQTTHRCIGIRF